MTAVSRCPSCGWRTLVAGTELDDRGRVLWACTKAGCGWRVKGRPPVPEAPQPAQRLPRGHDAALSGGTPAPLASAAGACSVRTTKRENLPSPTEALNRPSEPTGGTASIGQPSNPGRVQPPTVPEITEYTCFLLSVTVDEFCGNGRHAAVVLARTLVSAVSRRVTRLSFTDIARQMNRPNHSTIVTAIGRYAIHRHDPVADHVGGNIPQLRPDIAALTVGQLADQIAAAVTGRG